MSALMHATKGGHELAVQPLPLALQLLRARAGESLSMSARTDRGVQHRGVLHQLRDSFLHATRERPTRAAALMVRTRTRALARNPEFLLRPPCY